ncbi:TonB-dependent siderophore receptor [Pelistega ratti]|uniref:TonB-dependent siderophore receptor n=1 Tax=Pelistega ratti TaxID=2652177 RepID=UPI001358FE31|nr:TonB-dependent siderophore receptor [Pelistega ratti]
MREYFTSVFLMVLPAIGYSEALDTINVVEKKEYFATGYSPMESHSATKTATPLMRTPQSIEIISNKLMADQGVESVIDALGYHSGVISNYRGSNQLMEISIRGIGTKSEGGQLPIYVNGTSYSAAYAIKPFFIERMDILKGPSSVLYGQVNPGGIVDIITKKATGANKGQVQLVVGSNDRYQLGLDVERKISSTLSARLIGQAERMDWKERFVKERGGMIAPSIKWQPNDKTSLILYSYFSKQPEAGDRNFLVGEGTVKPYQGQKIPYDFFAGDPDYHKVSVKQYHLGSQFSHRFNDHLIFRQNLRYSQSREDFKNLVVMFNIGSELKRITRAWDEKSRELTIDNQLETNFQLGETRHTLLAGVDYKYYSKDSLIYLGSVADTPSIDWRHPIYHQKIKQPDLINDDEHWIKQTGLYAQEQIEWGKLDFLLGGRIDFARIQQKNRLKNTRSNQSEHKFTWRTGLIYNFDNGIAPYINYSTSFLPTTNQDERGNYLKPTTASQWEVGVKYAPNEKFFMTVAGYQITQKNLTNFDMVTRAYKQIGKVRTKGIEVDISAQISQSLSLLATYAYTHQKVIHSLDKESIGTTPWGVPRHQGSLWAKYQFDNGLSLSAGMRYFGSVHSYNNGRVDVPHFTLYDAAIHYDLNKVGINADVQFNIQNLTNKKYVSSCARSDTCFYGKERNANMTFNYYF